MGTRRDGLNRPTSDTPSPTGSRAFLKLIAAGRNGNGKIPPHPKAPEPQWPNIPSELTSRPHWVCWRYEEVRHDRDGKPVLTKVPYRPDGGRASSTDQRT